MAAKATISGNQTVRLKLLRVDMLAITLQLTNWCCYQMGGPVRGLCTEGQRG